MRKRRQKRKEEREQRREAEEEGGRERGSILDNYVAPNQPKWSYPGEEKEEEGNGEEEDREVVNN